MKGTEAGSSAVRMRAPQATRDRRDDRGWPRERKRFDRDREKPRRRDEDYNEKRKRRFREYEMDEEDLPVER